MGWDENRERYLPSVCGELDRLAQSLPLDFIRSNPAACVRAGVTAVSGFLEKTAASAPALSKIDLTVDQAYKLGLACLALRAEVLAASVPRYRFHYQQSVLTHRLDIFAAALRRRAMYVPILAADDAFRELIAERLDYKGRFPLADVGERIKALRANGDHIDWLPFDGAPLD